MTRLKFPIVKRKHSYDIAVINNYCKYGNYSCLLDSGASIPVWCSNLESFIYSFRNVVRSNAMYALGGFGSGGAEFVPVYIINDFILNDGKNLIRFKNLPVAVTDRSDISVNMVLSYTMFTKMNLSLMSFVHRNGFRYVEPYAKIESVKSEYYVTGIKRVLSGQEEQMLYQRYGVNNVIDNICVYSQSN